MDRIFLALTLLAAASAISTVPCAIGPGNVLSATISVGTAGVSFQVVVDTGSPFLVLNNYQPPSSAVSAGWVDVWYGSATVETQLYWDTVTIGGASSMTGVLAKTQGYGIPGDGILGVGNPAGIPPPRQSPWSIYFLKNLLAVRAIPSQSVGARLCSASSGQLSIGGVDPTLFTGSMSWTSMQTNLINEVSKAYVTVSSVNGQPVSPTLCSVDTGNTGIFLPSEWGTVDTIGLIDLNNQEFTIAPPPTQGAFGGAGSECVLGVEMLYKYYIVWDSSNMQIGFASPNCGSAVLTADEPLTTTQSVDKSHGNVALVAGTCGAAVAVVVGILGVIVYRRRLRARAAVPGSLEVPEMP